MSDFKTYWDFEEAERAALTREEVERFLDAELMTKGVLKVAPLALDEEPQIDDLATTAYCWVDGFPNVLFATSEAASAFVALKPTQLGSEYLCGDYRQSVKFAKLPEGTDINQVSVATQDEFMRCRSNLEKRATVRSSNSKRREQYDNDTKAQSKVLAGVWEDWARCRNIDQAHRRVVTTFRDYVKTAGDELTAARFLVKVFTFEQIDEARKWLGADIPDVIADSEFAEVEPAPTKKEAPEELCF
ncbi:MAG TPA: hypothetical protein VER11_34270 [Polyangiaceae bacterium]|nr:hypothetical protein [Polyangiaceae bacterium]